MLVLLSLLCSAHGMEPVEDELVSGPIVLRSPGDPAAGDPVYLKLKGELAAAVWEAMEGAEQHRKKRRGEHALASRANLVDPVVIELSFASGQLREAEGWELFHGLTPWIKGTGTLAGERLLLEGDTAEALRGALASGGTALRAEGPVELVMTEPGGGSWRLVVD